MAAASFDIPDRASDTRSTPAGTATKYAVWCSFPRQRGVGRERVIAGFEAFTPTPYARPAGAERPAGPG